MLEVKGRPNAKDHQGNCCKIEKSLLSGMAGNGTVQKGKAFIAQSNQCILIIRFDGTPIGKFDTTPPLHKGPWQPEYIAGKQPIKGFGLVPDVQKHSVELH